MENKDLNKEENVEDVNKVEDRFLTNIQKQVYDIEEFNKLIGEFESIDFLAEKYPSKMEKYNARLDEASKTPNASEAMSAIWDEINDKLEVSFEEKAVLISKNLLELASKHNFRIANWDNKFMVYNKIGYWEEVSDELIKEFASEIAIKAGLMEITAKQSRKKDRLLEQLFSDGIVIKRSSQEDDDKIVKINTLSGTYWFERGVYELRKHDPDDYLPYILNFHIDPNATAPLFQKYLDTSFPEPEVQKVLLEFIGSIFVRLPNLDKALILWGKPETGKSVWFNVVEGLIGKENMVGFTLKSLCDPKGYHRVELLGKLANYSSEIGSGGFDLDIAKKLFSNEPIEMRSPFQKPFMGRPMCRYIFNANSMPQMSPDPAFNRRLLIVPANQVITEKIGGLSEQILATELPGVFNMVLKGIERLVAQKGFTYSKEVDTAIKKFERISDNVKLYLEERGYQPSKEKRTKLSDMYREYKLYCSESGYSACALEKFVERLDHSRIIVMTGGGRIRYAYCETIISLDDKDDDENLSDLDKACRGL